ncbi:hypothetical protein JQC72_06120 [Polycladomyces sp. WAk]|uniref:Uncharacterized protein n=1 Tax=Polycladomyces zharkentensis TaxID=2807616 RepID=A0ABS2WHS4_9BACL|nr:hypothetical protein [Polycladomyces sp. WAk]MBN2909097.1 hypothetical protein [Polycladomyces sp. WAk]
MRETLIVLNRHGIKLWFSMLVGGFFSFCVMFTFTVIFIWMVAPSFFSRPVETMSVLQADVLPRILTRLSPVWQTGLGLLSTLLLFLMLFLLCGLMGAMREVTLHDRFSVGHFFYYGIRYPLRMIPMALIHAILIGLTGWGVAQIAEAMPPGPGQTVVCTVGGLVLLGLTVAAVHSPVILMVEKTGVFSAVRHSFRLLWLQAGPAVLSFLYSLILGTVCVTVLTMLIVCPWFVLQFFGDQTIANIIGGGFGGLSFALLHMIPAMLMIGTLYTRYVHLIRNKLFESKTDNQAPEKSTNGRQMKKDGQTVTA